MRDRLEGMATTFRQDPKAAILSLEFDTVADYAYDDSTNTYLRNRLEDEGLTTSLPSTVAVWVGNYPA